MSPISQMFAESVPSRMIRSDTVTIILALGGLAFMVLLVYAMEDAYATGYEKGKVDATIRRMEREEFGKDK